MSECTPTQEQLSDELDAALLAAVKLQKASAEPNAAILNAATARLKALGITKMVDPNSDAGKLAAECGLTDPNVLKMPSISDDPDAAVG
jgi:hypothetical protein